MGGIMGQHLMLRQSIEAGMGLAPSVPLDEQIKITNPFGPPGATLDPDTSENVYTLFGTPTSRLVVPPAFQVSTPFGADIGGVNPTFFGVMAEAQFDSWLT